MALMKPVRKAVLPVAGVGTRFLPVTKAVPKELLPIVDVPAIQINVEECVASGLRDLILITSRGKDALVDYFDRAAELEELLERKGKQADLAMIRRLTELAQISSVRQPETRGLGHAVLCARAAVGDEPFAVLLGDDLFEGNPPGIKQLLDVYAKYGKGVVGLVEVPLGQEHLYGIVDGEPLGGGVFRLRSAGGEARTWQGPVAPGHRGPLCLATRDLSRSRQYQARQGRRDSTDGCPGHPVRQRRAVRRALARRALRRWRPDGLRAGRASLCASPIGHRRGGARGRGETPARDVTAAPGTSAAFPGTLVQVAVTLPLEETFTYRDPRAGVRLPLGTEVIVPFGARQVTGFVVGHPETAAGPVRDITDVVGDGPPSTKPFWNCVAGPLATTWPRWAKSCARRFRAASGP
jgi:hypothetical protein